VGSRHEKTTLIVSAEPRADFDFADDLDVVADELVAEAGR
jgi:hypothetical protein